jgi:hypothetical protein
LSSCRWCFGAGAFIGGWSMILGGGFLCGLCLALEFVQQVAVVCDETQMVRPFHHFSFVCLSRACLSQIRLFLMGMLILKVRACLSQGVVTVCVAQCK